MNAVVLNARVTTDHELRLTLSDCLPAGTAIKITVEPMESMENDPLADTPPRTEIGRLALAARRRYLASGGRLLTHDEINAEVRLRRGGAPDE